MRRLEFAGQRSRVIAPHHTLLRDEGGPRALIPYFRPGDVLAADAVADAILHYAKVDTPIRAVMLSRLGPNVWHQDLTQAMATLEELEETAKLVQNSAPNLPENLSDAQIEELRQNFGAAW